MKNTSLKPLRSGSLTIAGIESSPMPDSSQNRLHLLATICLTTVIFGPRSLSAQNTESLNQFQSEARSLARSTPSTPMISARSRGHLDAMTGEVDLEAGLRKCDDERSRRAYLDAVFSGGATSFDPKAAATKSIAALRAVAGDDRAVRIADRVRLLSETEASTDLSLELTSRDLLWRPFTWSPSTAADEIAKLGSRRRQQLLEASDPVDRPVVLATILAATEGRPGPEISLDRAPSRTDPFWPTVIGELDRRDAAEAILNLQTDHPEVLVRPETRIKAAISVARRYPDAATALLGGEVNLQRLPGPLQSLIRASLAEGRRSDPDPEAWLTEAVQIAQLDDRLPVLLALARYDDSEPDPDRTLESVKSLRTLPAGRMVDALAYGSADRDAVIRGLSDLFLTGRYDLGLSFLAPNTTEPSRPADGWLPLRIGLLSEALADADAAPDAWIPLLVSVTRLHRVDAQIAALRMIEHGYDRIHDSEKLPPDLKATLEDTLLKIAFRG